MGYSKTKKAIRRVESYLIQMVESTKQLEFPSSNPTKLSRHIFEGIKASELFTKESPFDKYATLGAKYKIRNREAKVVCEPRDISVLTGSSPLSTVVIGKVNSVLGVIGAVVQHKQPIMDFPDVKNLNGLELQRLSNYSKTQGYAMIVSNDGIRLSKDPDHKSLEWEGSGGNETS